MAVVNLLGSNIVTTGGTETVVATPLVGDLIVIICCSTGITTTNAPTDGTGTYTVITSALKNTSADILYIAVRTTLVTSSVSTTYSIAPGASTGGGLAVYAVRGGVARAGTSAVVQSATQANIASGVPAPIFAATPKFYNCIISAIFNGTNTGGITARTSPAYTRDLDAGYNTPATGFDSMHIDSDETSATITWGSSSGSAFSSLAIEINMLPMNSWNNYEFVDASASNTGIISVSEKIH